MYYLACSKVEPIKTIGLLVLVGLAVDTFDLQPAQDMLCTCLIEVKVPYVMIAFHFILWQARGSLSL
jgi:hypothetical protein